MHVNANGRGQQDYKMFVVGHRAVGKSALVVRFLTNRFISEYQENSEMTCNGMVEVDGEKMPLRIQDTSEKGIRLPTIDDYFRAADAIMLVYSITDRTSFQRLRNTTARLRQKLKEQEFADDKVDKIPTLLIIGNKGDLDHSREVRTEEGMELAEGLDCHFYETSASEGWSKQFMRNRSGSMGSKIVNGVAPQRPSTLWSDKTATVRRKSDPALLLNSIFTPKAAIVTENDMNNNDNGSKRLLSVPSANVPQISISPSEDTHSERTPSRGRRFMQKLSPRFSRKFGGGPKQQNTPKMSNISAGLARMSAPGLAVGAIGRGNVNTQIKKTNNSNVTTRLSTSQAPENGCLGSISPIRERRNRILRADGSWSSSLSDGSSSSSESLVPLNDGEIRHALFFRPETPVSDANLSSSEEEDFLTISKSAQAASLSRQERRSRSDTQRNSLTQTLPRHCNADLMQKLNSSMPKRGRSETRMDALIADSKRLYATSSQKFDADYKEKKYNVSEPFKHLCRDARSARRMRDRLTPTRIFRDGIRKIKTSLVSDQAHHNNFHFKNPHFQVTAVSP